MKDKDYMTNQLGYQNEDGVSLCTDNFCEKEINLFKDTLLLTSMEKAHRQNYRTSLKNICTESFKQDCENEEDKSDWEEGVQKSCDICNNQLWGLEMGTDAL